MYALSYKIYDQISLIPDEVTKLLKSRFSKNFCGLLTFQNALLPFFCRIKGAHVETSLRAQCGEIQYAEELGRELKFQIWHGDTSDLLLLKNFRIRLMHYKTFAEVSRHQFVGRFLLCSHAFYTLCYKVTF